MVNGAIERYPGKVHCGPELALVTACGEIECPSPELLILKVMCIAQ